jgi:hypothetical protein
MCLERTNQHPQVSKIATQNITVFKCMRYDYYDKEIISPYLKNYYRLNELQIAPRCSLKNEGGFYSFRCRKTARKWITGFSAYSDKSKCKIFQCTIPKGSRYIEGWQSVHGDLRKCIRSKQIIFKKRLTR